MGYIQGVVPSVATQPLSCLVYTPKLIDKACVFVHRMFCKNYIMCLYLNNTYEIYVLGKLTDEKLIIF